MLIYPGFYLTVAQSNSNLRSDNQILNAELLSLQTNISRLEAQYENLSQQYGMLIANDSATINDLTITCKTLQTELSNANADNALLQAQYQNLLSYYSNVSDRIQILSQDANFNYLVFGEGNGTYLAQNGTTTLIDYSGIDGDYIIQNCIDSLNISGGKIVLAGKIALDTPLVINGSNSNGLLQLSGFGPSTQLMVENNIDGIDIFGNQAFGYGGPYHITVSDLVLSTVSGNCMNVGVHVTDWFDVNLENVMVFYADSAGVLVEDSANVNLNKVYVEGCGGLEYGGNVPLNGVGIYLKGCKDCFLQQCYSDTNNIGFLVESNNQTNSAAKGIFLNQCEATLNEQKGAVLSTCEGVSISSCLIEGTDDDGVMVVDSCNINLINTIVKGNAGNGVAITAENASMTECEITIQTCMISGNNHNGVGIFAKNTCDIGQINISVAP